MIRFDNVSKRYQNGGEALSALSFELNQGEMAFITGRSGAGKSTVLKLLMLMERVSQGQLLVNGFNLTRIGSKQIPLLRREIGVVFQDHQLLFDRTVFDNVLLPLDICNYPRRDAARRVRAALDKVGLLRKEKVSPARLSGGEQQRVGIARAIVNRPRLILADEPTGNLDPELSAEIMALFEQFNGVGVSVLVASHETSLISRLKHRTLTLDRGVLVKDESAVAVVSAGSTAAPTP